MLLKSELARRNLLIPRSCAAYLLGQILRRVFERTHDRHTGAHAPSRLTLRMSGDILTQELGDTIGIRGCLLGWWPAGCVTVTASTDDSFDDLVTHNPSRIALEHRQH
jgi:hypothetical protein